MTQPVKVFYIEDEPSLGKILSETLKRQGFDVRWESDGAKVISHFDSYMPDVCVLDIMLPNIDGYSLCRTIRGNWPELPVIFLTAKTETADLVKGFEAGGTDYMKKPFSIEELIARINNQINLRGGRSEAAETTTLLKIGKYTLDTLKYDLITPRGTIRLSNRDMQVLRMLWGNRNSVTPRKDLLLAVWGDDSYFNSRNLDVYIRKLRGYFDSDSSVEIITLKGSGYLFLVS